MTGIRIGRLFGIDVAVNPSWLFVVVFLTFVLAKGFFPSAYTGWSSAATWTAAVAATLLLFASVLAHEFGHSLVARSQGIPVIGITLFLLGGVARLGREPDSPGREAWMAIAGPLVSVAIAAGSIGLAFALPGPEQLVAVLAYLGVANAALVAFNLLPGFPLDGGRVLRAFLWWRSRDLLRATRRAALVGQVFAWGFIALGAGQLVLGGGLGGIWLALVGWLMVQAARATTRQAEMDRALAGVSAGRIMTTPAAWLSPFVTLAHAAQGSLKDYESRCLPVAAEDPGSEYGGLVCARDLQQAARERFDRDRVRDVMASAPDLPAVTPETQAIDVLRLLRERETDRAVVIDAGGRLIGFIDADTFTRLLNVGRPRRPRAA